MTRVFLTLICAVLFGPAAMAQTPIDRFDISINAESEQDQSAIVALANTFALMAPKTSGLRRASRLDVRSGVGLVQNGTATKKLRDSLPPALSQSIARLSAMRNPCDVSRHRFNDADVLVVVHTSDNAQPQDALRCFVAGLWIYHAGAGETTNVDDWRVPYARIIGTAAGGRPAFAGFETEEN